MQINSFDWRYLVYNAIFNSFTRTKIFWAPDVSFNFLGWLSDMFCIEFNLEHKLNDKMLFFFSYAWLHDQMNKCLSVHPQLALNSKEKQHCWIETDSTSTQNNKKLTHTNLLQWTNKHAIYYFHTKSCGFSHQSKLEWLHRFQMMSQWLYIDSM